MPRIQTVDVENATGKTAEVLSKVKKKLGKVPNIVSTMANSPAVANAYLSFSAALAEGTLSAALREQIALAVGEKNECGYCISAHSFIGKKAGLSDDDVLMARRGDANDAKHSAALHFATMLVEQRGNVSDEAIQTVRDAGFSDGQIAEIVAAVSLNIFTNYFNHVADTAIDFPVAPELMHA